MSNDLNADVSLCARNTLEYAVGRVEMAAQSSEVDPVLISVTPRKATVPNTGDTIQNPSVKCSDTQMEGQTSNALDLVMGEKKLYSLDDAQPLDPMSFPNQPRPGVFKVPTTIQNIRHILTSYGVVARYNVIKKKLHITLPHTKGTTDNADNVAMAHITNLAVLNGLSAGQVSSFVAVVADSAAFNPVANWIISKPWDGQDRLAAVYGTINTREDFPKFLKEILMYRWLLSCVAAAFMGRGFRARGVLTFQGAQGVGKTSWVMSLVPDPLLRDMVVKVDHHLDGNNKDSILTAVSHWIVEIGELDSSFKKDIARLKGFLTSDQDKLRPPYARTDAEYARRTVFCATVNESNFLVDMTGNTRWWTIPVTTIDFKHGIDMQQVFAQLAVEFHKEDVRWWLSEQEDELLELHNRDHRSVSIIRERLLGFLNLELIDRSSMPAMTASEVLKLLGFDKASNPQCKECGAILRELLGEPKKTQGAYKWRIPLKTNPTPSLAKQPSIQSDDDDY